MTATHSQDPHHGLTHDMLVVDHHDLSGAQRDALRGLFDSEYRESHGEWDPDRPYGYSPADVHTLLFHGSTLLGHVGFQRRRIAVGSSDVCVAGTGGVLVHPRRRGEGIGRSVMSHAQDAMRRDSRIDFGYLGCRDEVVPFYESTGWVRVNATERHVSMTEPGSTEVLSEGPILVFPASGAVWPPGDIDLRGTPW